MPLSAKDGQPVGGPAFLQDVLAMIPNGERDNFEATVRDLAAEDVVSDRSRIDSGRVEANRMIQQYRAKGNSHAANLI